MLKPILAALALATPALPPAQSTAPVARVAVADLDLATAAGMAQFDRRLAAAVRDLCPAPHSPDLRERRDHRTCVATVERSAADARARTLAAAAPVAVAAR